MYLVLIVIYLILIVICFVLGPVVTVDEQLIPFRGHCKFRMYLPNKPHKYGLKIFMVCDSKTMYCIQGMPYLGKGSVPASELRGRVLQGEYFTMKLLELGDLIEIGRVVVADNWFVSRDLVETLQLHGMHLVGTIKPKPYLPDNSLCISLCKEQECVAYYDHDKNVNYVVKRKKKKAVVTIMTTVHNSLSMVEGTKTEAHMYYNATKGGVDGFDKIVAVNSVHRKTLRWPMCIFYGMINIATANAWIIFKGRNHQRKYSKMDFMQTAAYTLAAPWAEERYRRPQGLERHQRDALKNYFNITDLPPQDLELPQQDLELPQQDPEQHQEPHQQPQRRLHQDPGVSRLLGFVGVEKMTVKKQRCVHCPNASRYSGKYVCYDCDRNVCPKNHSLLLCTECLARQKKWIPSHE